MLTTKAYKTSQKPVSKVSKEEVNDDIKYLYALPKFFPPKSFSIQYSNDPEDKETKIINITDKQNKYCIVFSFHATDVTDYVELESLGKCNSGSGTNLLKRFEKFAQTLPKKIKKIILVDASTLYFCSDPERHYRGISVPLNLLFALSTGQTWYESLGYESSTSLNNKINNTNFIENNTIANVLPMFQEKYPNEPHIDYLQKLSQQSDPQNLTVQEFFQHVKRRLQEVNQDEDCKDADFLQELQYLKKFMSFFVTKNFIAVGDDFDIYFRKNIKRGGGSTRRKSKKNRKTQRRRRS